MGCGPRLDRQARIQFGQVHFGVFSTSRVVPLALSSDWLEVLIFRHWRGGGVPTDLKCRFFVTHGGFQLTWSVEFLSLIGGFNWLEVCFVLSFYFVLTTLYFSPALLHFSLNFCFLFCTFDVLFLYFATTFFEVFHHLFPLSPILCKFRKIF